MSTNKRILIACDLDGTLLKNNLTFGLYTKLFFRKLEKEGHIIIFSTGRAPRTCNQFRKAIGLHGPMVCLNGNLVINPDDPNFKERKIMWDHNRHKKIFKKLCDEGRIDGAMCENDNSFYSYHKEYFPFSAGVGEPRKCFEGRFDEILDEDVYNFVLYSNNNSKENREYCKKYIEETYPNIKFDFWGNPNKFYVSLLHKDNNKAVAVDYVRKFYNIDKDDVYIFGDSSNDIQQVTSFKNGYAMKNAFDCLKDVAKNITKKDNNHNGVAHEIHHILKTKYSR